MFTTADRMLLSISSLAALAIAAGVWAWSWKGWLELKKHELGAHPAPERRSRQPAPNAGNRIELADLRERVRKLEAIAAGVDM